MATPIPESTLLPPEPLSHFMWHSAKRGVRYASWFVLLGAGMGALYGLLTGYVLAPALFVVVFCGVLVLLNVLPTIMVLLLNLLLAPFGGARRTRVQYVVMSLSFLAVYLLVFALLKLSGAQIF